ncbi:MAG: hypothetical protein CFE25_06170 [Chitinophagaceae bacterium BSSC1]|nr:MAG: hypothetical protein CFE25_06170 [Chitinophagaceae bacterium BSSC1]
MQSFPVIGIRKGKMFNQYSKSISIAAIGIIILTYFNILPISKLLDPWVLIYILIIAGIPFLLSVLKYIDKKPMIIVDKSGVSIRKSRLPFSSLAQIEWNDIKGYTADVIHTKFSETCFLIISKKSTNKKYYVDLYDLKNGADILNAVEKKLNQDKMNSFQID